MKPLNLVHSFMAIMNIAVALLFIVASFSDSVSPNQNVFFSYLGLLFPVFFVFNFCFLMYWLIMRKWGYFFIICCSFLICWKPISQYAPFHFRSGIIPHDKVIKVLSYNVMGFGYKDHSSNKPNEVLQYIINSDADIVCLQEYMVGKSDDFLTQRKICEALNMYSYHYNLPLVNYNKYTIGLAIFSKYPILNSWKVRYDSSFNGSSVHEIDVNGKKVMVINNHLESFKLTMDDRSKYADFIKNMNVETFDGFRETIQRKLGSAFRIRAEQAEIVADEIANLEGDYKIVCGDFNDTPISYAHRVIQGKSLVDAYSESGQGIGISYNQNFFWFRIDHILHSVNMKSYNTTIEKIALSDHYPIWTYLEMN